MCTGRLLLLLLSGLAAATTSEIACPEPASCTRQVDCARNYYSVSKVCFTRTECKQFSICPARDEAFDLHLSLSFLTPLPLTPCHLWLSNATGRQQYDLRAEGPGATGLYLRTALAGGNVTIQYMCDGSAPEVASGSGAVRLAVEYYFDPHSRPLCSVANTSYRCDTKGCVPLAWRCNGLAECSDGYDEYNCATPPAAKDQRTTELLPSHGSVPCGAGGCGSPIRKPDCTASDGDSLGCRTSSTESSASTSAPCAAGNATFRCSESSICIPATWRCDQSLDCSDGSDENDCEGASVRVITAAVIGSLVCSILVVIAAGCTCKLYTLRMMQEQRHHRRSRRYEMPMTAFQSELMRRRAPPPSYDAAMRPPAEATTTTPPAAAAELLAAAAQQQPLDEMQRELLAHIEAVATAVRAQHTRHHHHHRRHHHQRSRLTAESDLGSGAAAVAAIPQEMMSSSLTSATAVERRPCQQQPRATLACLGCSSSGGSDPSAAESHSLHADVTGRTRAGHTECAIGGSGSVLPSAAADSSTATQQHASQAPVGLTACSHADGDGCERARAAAVHEQLDQFLPTLPNFRCIGHRNASSATVDNVRITASLTASYERTCHSSGSSDIGAAAASTGGSRGSTWTRGGGGGPQQQQQQRATYNVAFVASESDDEPLLFSGGSRGDSSAESSSSSAASTPAADAHAPLLGYSADAYGCDDGAPAAASAAVAAVVAMTPRAVATCSVEPLTSGAPVEPAAVGGAGGAAASATTLNSAGALARAARTDAAQQHVEKL